MYLDFSSNSFLNSTSAYWTFSQRHCACRTWCNMTARSKNYSNPYIHTYFAHKSIVFGFQISSKLFSKPEQLEFDLAFSGLVFIYSDDVVLADAFVVSITLSNTFCRLNCPAKQQLKLTCKKCMHYYIRIFSYYFR